MEKSLIYIIDNQPDIRRALVYNFERQGHDAVAFVSAEKCLRMFKYLSPDLVITEIHLPGKSGLELLNEMKMSTPKRAIPVIIITETDDEQVIEEAFRLDADDYILKPFNINELNAKVKKALLHQDNEFLHINSRKKLFPEKKRRLVTFKGLSINAGSYEVLVDQNRIDLTYAEFKLLQLLTEKPDTAITREDIIKADGGSNYIVTERAVDVRVAGLRKKLGNYGYMIKTIRSVGYLFNSES